ncbi:MAG: Ig-like domain-containing protein, partial [Bifidobacteriaceae bacterium]|nr:Ig-like domain-containing protein [Bifidobacteriaceae bacterium]
MSATTSPKSAVPTRRARKVARRAVRSVIKPVVFLVSGAIALGGVTLAQNWVGDSDTATAADFPQTANWQALPSNWSFIWADSEGLDHNSAYIAPTPDAAPSTTLWNNGVDILEQIVFDKDAGTSRAVSTLKARVTSSIDNGAFGIFETAAVGPLPEDPDTLAVYFWGYASQNGPWNLGLTCNDAANGKNVLVLRVKDLATTGEVTCAPHDTATLGTWGDGETTGGEVDQLTGKLYIQSNTSAEIDNQSATSSARSTVAGFSYTVWDPSTGTAVRSGQIQPATQEDRAALRSSPDGHYTISDMALDANGNIYVWAATDSSSAVKIIRVVPTKDQNGAITEGSTTGGIGDPNSWLYNFVTTIDHPATSETATTYGGSGPGGWVGMFFDHGRVYATGYKNLNHSECTPGNSILEADPLANAWKIYCTGEATPQNDWHFFDRAARAGNNVDDGASPQTAAVIEARVVEDANGDGVIATTDHGVAGQKVALYDSNFKLLSIQTTSADGWVSFLVSDVGTGATAVRYYTRLVQPQVNRGTTTSPVWVNATQTWALAGNETSTVLGPGQNPNSAEAVCSTGDVTTGGSLWTLSGGAACNGASDQPIPDKNVGAVGSTAAVGDFAYYTIVDMYTDRDVADVGFGIAAQGSWGDAMASTKTTAADKGAYHLNSSTSTVQIGSQLGSYTNGTVDTASANHTTDDGVFFQVARSCHAGETAPCHDLIPMQDQLLSLGRTYDIVVQTTASPATIPESDIKVNAWISPVNSTTLSSTSTRILQDVVPSGGQAVAQYQPPLTPAPSAAVSAAQVRVSASTASGITEPDNTNGQYAPAAGSSAANTRSWISNGEIEDYRVWLTKAQVRIALQTDGGTIANQAFTLQNVVNGTSAPQNPSRTTDSITTTVSGEEVTSSVPHAITSTSAQTIITAAAFPTGWQLKTVTCYGSVTGDVVPTSSYTVNQSARSVTLAANFFGGAGPTDIWNDVTCEFLVSKIPDTTSTLELSTTSAVVGTDVTATVTAKANGQTISGEEVQITVPSDITVKDANGTTLTGPGPYKCTTGATGSCSFKLTTTTAGTYTVHGQVNINGTWTDANDDPGHDPAKQSPQDVTFTPGGAASGKIAMNPTTGKYADYQSGDPDYQPDDYYTLDIWAYDTNNNGVTGLTDSDFTFTCPNAPGTNCSAAAFGVVFGSVSAVTGQPGHYQVPVYSSKSGTKQIAVSINSLTDPDYSPLPVDGQTSPPASDRHVDPEFKAMEKIDPAQSTFSVDTAGTVKAGYASDSQPGPYRLGTIVLKDVNGSPVTGAAGRLSEASSDPAETHLLSFTEDSTTPGTYTVHVHSSAAGSFTPVVTYISTTPAQSVNLTSSNAAVFVEPEPDPGHSSFVINDTADKKADGVQAYTGTVTLKDVNDVPVRDGVGNLTFAATPSAGVSFSDPVVCVMASGVCTGVYTVQITSTSKGAKSVTATYTPTSLALGPQTATFVQPDVSIPDSTFEVTPSGTVLPDGTAAFTATATLWGEAAHTNPIENENVVFTLSTTGTTVHAATLHNGATTNPNTLTVASSALGKSEITITATAEGTYSICATVGGTNLPGSCKAIEFKAGSPDPMQSDYEVSTADVVADNTSTGTITVRLKDAANVAVGGQASNITAAGPFGSGLTISAFTETATQGTYTATFKGTDVGAFHIDVIASGSAIGGASHTDVDGSTPNHYAHLVAGGLCTDPGTSGQTIAPTTAIDDTHPSVWADNADTYTITSTLVDCYGHGLTDWVPSKYWPSVRIGGATAPAANYTLSAPVHQGNGVYTQTIKAAKSGTYTITTGYGAVSGTATPVKAGGVEAKFDPKPGGAGYSLITINNPTPAPVANNSDTYTITVTLKDENNDPVTDGLAVLGDGDTRLRLIGPSGTDYTLSALAAGGTAGVYTATIKASQDGTYNISAVYGRGTGAITIDGSPVSAVFGPVGADPAHSSYVLSTGDKWADGVDAHTITVTLGTASGQAVILDSTGLAQLTATAVPSGVVSAFTAVSGSPGVYRANITTTLSGEKTVTVTAPGATGGTFQVSPATAGANKVNFIGGLPVNPLGTFDTTTGNRLIDGVAFHEVWVDFKDANGNPATCTSNGTTSGTIVPCQVTFELLNETTASGIATTGARFDNANTGTFTKTVQADANGRALAKVYSIFASDLTLGGFPVDAKIDTSTSVVKRIPFRPDTASASHSTFTVTPAPPTTKVADGIEYFSGQIIMKSANDSLVPGATAAFSICKVDGGSCVATSDVTVSDPGGGPAVLVASNPAAEINVKFTSTKAATYRVTATIAGDPIGAAAPYYKEITFVAGPPSGAASQLIWTTATAVANGSDTKSIQAEVKDANGNLVADGTTVLFSIPADTKVGSVSGAATITKTTTNGLAEILVTSEKAGTYNVTATVGGQNITGNSPAQPQFVAGPADASTSVLSITTTGDKVANGSDYHTAQVEIKDAQGNATVNSTTTVRFCWSIDGGAETCENVTSSVVGSQSLATKNITSTKAGTLLVKATINGNSVTPPAGVTANFIPGTPDAGVSTLEVSTGKVANNGTATHWAKATVKDANGNVISNANVTFTVTGNAQITGAGGTGQSKVVATSIAGLAEITITDITEETVTVTATITQGTIGTATVEFGPSNVDAGNSTFTVSPTPPPALAASSGGTYYTATVTLRDASNAIIANTPVNFTFSGTGPQLVGGGTTATTDSTGVATAQIYSQVKGDFTVTAASGGINLVNPSPAAKPINFDAGAIDAGHSTLTAQTGAATANGTATRWVEALVRDQFDNPVSGATVQFTFPSDTSLASASTNPVTTGTDGKARIELTSTKKGDYTVSATAAKGGSPVAITPAVTVSFEAGPASAGNSTLSVPTAAGGGTKVADGIEKHQAKVVVKDANGNLVDAGVAVSMSAAPPAGSGLSTQTCTAYTDANGEALCEFASTKAGDHTIRATIGGTEVGTGSPATATFVPGAIDAGHSTFTVSSDVTVNNGIAQHKATVIVRDQYDNVIENAAVRFTIDAGLTTIPGPVLNNTIAGGNTTKNTTTGTDGSVETPIVSEEEGTFTVEAFIGPAALTLGTKTVSFTPGPASVANSSWTKSPAGPITAGTATSDPEYTITVTVKSADNLLVGGSQVRLSDLGGTTLDSDLVISEPQDGSGYWLTGTKGTTTYGQVVLHVKSAHAGDYPVVAQILPGDGWPDLVNPASYTLSYEAGAPVAANSWLVEPAAGALANGTETQTVLAKIRDKNGDPVADGTTVTFTAPSGVSPTGTQTATTTGGTATLTVTSTSAGQYNITATVGGSAINTVKNNAETSTERTNGNAQVNFSAGGASAVDSVLSVPSAGSDGLTTKVANNIQKHRAEVLVKDVGGHNTLAGESVTFTYGPDAAHLTTVTAVSGSDGVAFVEFASTLAATYEVRAYIGANNTSSTDEVTDSPKSATFVAGPLDPDKTKTSLQVEETPAAANGTQTLWVKMTAQDAYGNPVSGATLGFKLTDTSTYSAVFQPLASGAHTTSGTSGSDGVVQVYAVSAFEGTFPVVGTVGASESAPKNLVFQNNTADPTKSWFTVVRTSTNASPDKAIADNADSYTVTVNLRDTNGDPVNNIGAVVWMTSAADASVATSYSVTTGVVSGQGGTAVQLLKTTVAGSYIVTVELAGDQISLDAANAATKSKTVEFVAGPWSQSTSSLVSPSTPAQVGGGTQTITAQLRDQYNNPVPNAAVQFAIPADITVGSVNGPAYVTVNTGTNGNADLVTTSAVVGEYNITAQVAGVSITTGSPAKAKFINSACSAAQSEFTIPSAGADGLTTKVVGVGYHNPTVTVKDGSGNLCTAEVTQVTYKYRLQGGTTWTEHLPAINTVNAVAEWANWTETVAGTYEVQAFFGGQQVGTTKTAIFVPDSVSPGTSTLTVSVNAALANNTATQYAKVVVKDQYGNPVVGQAVNIAIGTGEAYIDGPVVQGTTSPTATVTSCDPAAAGAPTWCDQKGLAMVYFTSSEPGGFQVTATIGGSAVGGSPAQVSFESGPADPTKSSWVISPDTVASPTVTVPADGSSAYSLTTTIKSAAEILVPNAAVRIVNLNSAVSVAPVAASYYTGTPADGASKYGKYTWTLTSTTKGVFTGQVQVATSGTTFENVGQPFTVRFSADVADAASSWLIEPAGTARADNTETQTVQAKIYDAHGNLVEDGTVVTFTLPSGVSPTGTQTATTTNGIASISMTSGTQGTYEVGASVGGAAINTVKNNAETTTQSYNKAKVPFAFGDPDPNNSVLTVPTAGSDGNTTKVANGLEKHRAEVLVKDSTNNLVPGASVTFTYGPDAAHLTTVTAVSGSDGVAFVEFSSTVATTYTVTGEIAGDAVSGSPKTAKFVAGPVDPTKTLNSFEVQQTAALANGSDALWAKMTAQDANGNPVSGVNLGFKLTDTAANTAVFQPLATGSKTASGTSGADGVVQVYVVSVYEGHFPVVGVMGASETSPKTVWFQNNTADPDESWFTVQRTSTNVSPDKAIADGNDSYTVTVNLRDANGDPVNGIGAVVKATPVAGGTTLQYSVITDVVGGQGGTAVQQIKTTVAGQYVVTVELAGDAISLDTAGATTTSKTVEFVAGAPSSLTSSLTSPASPAQVGGGTQVITATVKDANGNPVLGTNVVFTIPADVTAAGGTTVATGTTGASAGVAELTLTSNKVGEYNVTAKVGTMDITVGSPAKAKFVNSDPSAGQSEFTIPTTPAQKVAGVEYHTPQVAVKDGSGNAYTAAAVTVTFKVRLQGASTWATTKTVQTNTTTGIALWSDWTQDVAGTYEVEASISSGVVGTTLTAVFKAGPADPATSVFETSTGDVLADDASTHYAKVTVKDAKGNVVANEPVTFTLDPAKSAHFVPGTAKTITVNSSAAGIAQADIADGTPETVQVTGSVASTQVGSGNVKFTTDAPSAPDSSWTITPAGPITADGVASYTATVTVRDSSPSHLVVPNATVDFSVPPAVHITESGPYVSNSSGIVTVHFTSTTQGDFTVNALIGTGKIPAADQVIGFRAGAVDGTKSSLAGPGVTATADGVATQVVTATVKDAYDNPVTDATVRFAIPADTKAGTVTGPATVDVTVNSNGVATLALTSTKAGQYNVTAGAKKPADAAYTNITTGSPAVVEFVAGAIDPTHSKISKVETGPFVAGAASYTVKVELMDANDNPVKQAGLPIQFTFTLGADVVPASASTNANGVATTTFGNTKAGDWQGTATYQSQAIVVGSPVSLVFTAGAADPTKSTLEVSNNPAQADNTATHYAKVVVRDANNNPIVGESVTITISTGAATVPGPVVQGTTTATATVASCDPAAAGAPAWCDTKGLAMVRFTSSEPGTFDVTGTLGSTPVSGSPAQVSFTTGAPDPSKSSRVIDPDTDANATLSIEANGTAAYTVTATIKDAAEVLVPNASVRINALSSDVTVTPALQGLTGVPLDGVDKYGKFTWTLKSLKEGTFTGQVQVNTGSTWANVGQPFEVRFHGGAPSGANSELSSPNMSARADGTMTQLVMATLKDANGNVATCWSGTTQVGCPVVFSLPSQTTPTGSQSVTAALTGIAVISMTSTTVGTFDVTATVSGSPIEKADGVAAASGTAAKAHVQFTDATAPGEPVVNPSNGQHIDGHVDPADLADAANGELTVKITDPDTGTVIATCPVRADGTFDCPITPALADGEEVEVTIVDASGNESDPTDVVIDAVAPNEPVVDPSNGHQVTGHVDPADLTDASNGDLEVVIIDEATGNEITRCPVAADGTFNCPLNPALPDGTEVNVVIEDPAGNQSDPTPITVDATPPGRPTVDPSNGDDVTGHVAAGDLADAAAGELEVVVKDKATGQEIARCPVAADGTFDCDITPPITQNGKEITVAIEDAAHNVSTPVTVVVDTLAPNEPVVNPSDGTHVDGHVDPADVTDAAKGDLTVEVRDPVTGDVIATCPVRADGTFDCPISPALPDGTEVDVVIVDKAGNVSDPTEVTVDAVAPGEPTVNPSDGKHVDGHVDPADVADAAAGDLTVEVRDPNTGDVIATCPVRADGTFDCPISPALPDGTEVDVVIVDAAGNDSDPAEVTVDAVAPRKPTVDPSKGDDVTGHVDPADLADAANGDLTVVVKDKTTGATLATCPVAADGTFDCDIVPPITQDGKEITVSIKDPAGNVSAPTTVKVDTVAPNEPVVNPSDGKHVDGHVDPADVTDAAKGDLTVEVRDPNTGDVIATCPVKADGTFDCPITPALPDGTEVDVVIVDKAGNVS